MDYYKNKSPSPNENDNYTSSSEDEGTIKNNISLPNLVY